jgi:hypothetical protein
MIRLSVDFNALSPDGKKVQINPKHSNAPVADQFKPGLRVLLVEPDLEVEATLALEGDEEGREWWYGIADWSTQRDVPYP